jgi:hypothetical protein
MRVGLCHLCLERRPLHGRSYIIPDFMFRMAREHPKDQLVYVNLRTMVTNPDYKPPKRRKHPHVREMFCTRCEGLMHRYDDYLDAVLKNPKKRPRAIQSETSSYPSRDRLLAWTDFEAWRIPLAVLSIVLRGAVTASRLPFYADIRLADTDISTIRRMVLEEQWSDEIMDFDIVIQRTDSMNPGNYPAAVASPAVHNTPEGGVLGLILAGGSIFLIGRPFPAFKFSYAIPRPTPNQFYLPVKPPDFMQGLTIDLAKAMIMAMNH